MKEQVDETRQRLRLGALLGAVAGLVLGVLLRGSFGIAVEPLLSLSVLLWFTLWLVLGAIVCMSLVGWRTMRGHPRTTSPEETPPSDLLTSPMPALLSPRQLEQVVASGEPVMVEFHRPTCPHCATLEPTIEQLAREWQGRAVVGMLDLQAHPKVAEQRLIMGTPTVLVFSRGEEVARLTGVQNRLQYERALEKAAARS